MLMSPMPERRRRRRSARTRPLVSVTDEQEAAGFMAFMGEHSQFAATHRGA